MPTIPAACEEDAVAQAETVCEELRVGFECQAQIFALIPWPFSDLFGFKDSTLKEVPQELQFVLANRARFEISDHPLADVTLGAGGTDSAQLAGCWVRVQNMRLEDDSAEWVEAAFLTIDLENAVFETSVMKGVDGQPCYGDPRPYIVVSAERIVSVSDENLTVEGTGQLPEDTLVAERTTAGLNPDGSVSTHIFARLEWQDIGFSHPYEKPFALAGDFLATSTERGQIAPTNHALWTRLDCSEVGGSSE